MIRALLLALACASWPQAAARLTLADAVKAAVQNNLDARLAVAQSEEGRAHAVQSAARLLPNLFATASQGRILRQNLAATGFLTLGIPGIPTLLGPYNVFDARIELTQEVFDWTSVKRLQSARAQARVASLRETLAREQVAAAAALAYLEALRADRAVQTTQADVDLAQKLLALAEDQHDAGMATGLDVTRSQTREAQQRLRLVQAQAAAKDADLRLKRVVGLPLGEPLELAEILASTATALPQADAAVSQALASRTELKIGEEQVSADSALVSAARGERLPSLTVGGDLGLSGNTPTGPNSQSNYLTGSVGAKLMVPIFAGNQAAGDIRERKSLMTQSEEKLADFRQQVEEDARLAVQRLDAAAQEVQTAALAQQLAKREVELSQGRFQAGVANNIELVTAQDVLASAEQDQTAALVDFNSARVNLAMALGRMLEFKY